MINQPAKATANALSTPLSVASNQTVCLARHFLTTTVTCSKRRRIVWWPHFYGSEDDVKTLLSCWLVANISTVVSEVAKMTFIAGKPTGNPSKAVFFSPFVNFPALLHCLLSSFAN
jgi:hypothetical protein